jgi:hypothetical protein
MMLNRHHEMDFNPFELAPYHVGIKEARFFFPDSMCQWLNTLWDIEMTEFLTARLDPGSPEFMAVPERLLQRFHELPDLFAPEMGLQLTCR